MKNASKAAAPAFGLVAVLVAVVSFTTNRPVFAAAPGSAGSAAPDQPFLTQEEARRYAAICWNRPDGRPMNDAERSICQVDAFRAAPDDRLIEVMRAKAAMVRAMSSLSAERCGAFLTGDWGDWNPSSPALKAASRQFFRALIFAQYAGATTPQKRGAATSDDRNLVVELMLKAPVGRAEAEAALSGKVASLLVTRRCAAQAALFDAVAAAPKPVAGRMAVRLVPMSSPYER